MRRFFTKCFFIVIIVLFVINYNFVVTYDEESWQKAGHYLTESLDYSKDPCEDFYGFVCGKWKEKFSGPYIYREYQKAAKEVISNLTKALDGFKLDDLALPQYQRSLKYFVEQCKQKLHNNDEELVEDIYKSLDEYFLPKIMMTVDGEEKFPWEIDNDNMIWKYAGILMREQNTPFLLDVYVETHKVNCRENPILIIDLANTEKFDLLNRDVLKILVGSVAGRHHNITFDQKDINETLEEIIALEKDLYDLWHQMVGNKIYYQYKDLLMGLPELKFKLNNLFTEMPDIGWKEYFDGLLSDGVRLGDDNFEVYVRNKNAINGIKQVLGKHNRTAIYNYGYALVIQRYYDLFKMATKEDEVDVTRDFGYQKVLQMENPCLYLAFQYLPAASTRLIFDVYNIDPDHWRYGVNIIAENIFAAFRYLTYSLDWMDNDDKVLVNKKVDNMEFAHVIPEWLSDLQAVNLKTPRYVLNLSLIANDIITRRGMLSENLNALIKGKIDQRPPKFDFNAQYVMLTIRVWLGVMLPPIYNDKYPLAVQYGSVGMIIGHEMFHGFDDYRIRYENPDKTYGKPWLKPSTLKHYKQKSLCLVKQYSKYCFKEGDDACVKGEVSLNDNIADVEGLKVAYVAYKFQKQMLLKEEPPVPQMDNFTHDQIFFISNARQWCNGMNPDQLRKIAFSDHAPDHTRVDLPVTNNRPFAKAFRCPVGSRHAPIKTCDIWGSYWG